MDNFIIRFGKLVGVIDFENAGFSDPIYEFLLAFFVEPKLRGRGIEQRYCTRMGYDPRVLPWYHGLEYFDTWHWVRKTGESFVHYTDENLRVALGRDKITPIDQYKPKVRIKLKKWRRIPGVRCTPCWLAINCIT